MKDLFQKVYVLDSVQMKRKGVDEEVLDEISELWIDNEYDNDDYYHPWSEDDSAMYPALAEFIEKNAPYGSKIMIHEWW